MLVPLLIASVLLLMQIQVVKILVGICNRLINHRLASVKKNKIVKYRLIYQV